MIEEKRVWLKQRSTGWLKCVNAKLTLHTRIDSLTVSFFPNVEEEYKEINNIIIEENSFFSHPLNKFSSVFDLLRGLIDRMKF